MGDIVYPDLAVTRRNIVCIACAVVKVLCRLAVETTLDEFCPAVNDLLTVLENVFYHGLKRRSNFWVGHPWSLVSYVCERVCPGCVKKIELIRDSQSDYSKLRMWIKIALLEHRLPNVFPTIQTAVSKLDKLYYKGALLLSNDLDQLVEAARRLESLEFSLNVKEEYGTCNRVMPIDYTPYISGNVRYPDKPASGEEGDDTHGRQQFVAHQDAYEVPNDDQHSIEDKLKWKQVELDRCMAELAAYKVFRRDLGDTVLHLQRQVERTQSKPHSPTQHPSAVKQWFDLGRRTGKVNPNRSLESVNANSPCIPSCSLSGFPVDQGLDALAYDSSSCEVTEIPTLRTPPRPSSLYVPPTYAVTVEVGEEPEFESQTIEPSSSHSITSACVPPEGLVSSRKATLQRPCSELKYALDKLCQHSSLLTGQREKRILPMQSKSALRLGMQKLPELHEQFVLPETPSPQSISTVMLVSETQDPFGGAKLSQIKPIYRPVTSSPLSACERSQPRTPPVQSKDIQLDGQTATDSTSIYSGMERPSIVVTDPHPQIIKDFIDQASLDSTTSSDLQTSPERSSHNLLHVNKDYYQITSQSEEDFDSSYEASDHGTVDPGRSSRKPSLLPDDVVESFCPTDQFTTVPSQACELGAPHPEQPHTN